MEDLINDALYGDGTNVVCGILPNTTNYTAYPCCPVCGTYAIKTIVPILWQYLCDNGHYYNWDSDKGCAWSKLPDGNCVVVWGNRGVVSCPTN